MAMKNCIVDVGPIPLSSCSHERVLPHSPGGSSIRSISRPSLYLFFVNVIYMMNKIGKGSLDTYICLVLPLLGGTRFSLYPCFYIC